jgi:hypothetical protein
MPEPTAPRPEAENGSIGPSTASPGSTADPASTVPPPSPADARTLPQPLPDPGPTAGGPQIAGYRILGTLGRGGMGVVYRARQASLDRDVALKVILSGGHASPQERARFVAEARAVGRLGHANIVQLFDAGESDGNPFFVMEFVAGGSLADRREWTPDSAADMVETLARAIHHAHLRRIVHRDLKPANVLLTADGQPKVTDFGLAKWLDASMGATGTGAIMGTPAFMAPEQASGRAKEVGPAADVWALGAILYALLTGRPPFRGETQFDVLSAVVNTPATRPSLHNPAVPPALDAICLKCLAKDPADRYPSAATLADAVARFRAGEPAPRTAAGRSAKRSAVGRSWLTRLGRRRSAALLAGLVLVGLTALVWRQQSGDRNSGPIPNAVPAVAVEPVKVGVLHSLSGTMATSTSVVVDATLFGIDEVNQAGGVLGRPIKPVVADGASDWPTFAREAERLISEEKVCTIFGCWSAAVASGFSVYLAAGLSASPAFQDLAVVGWAVMLVLWVDDDARRRRRIPCFDFGLLVGVLFPLSVAWYCI